MAGHYGIREHCKHILTDFVNDARKSGNLYTPIPLDKFLNLDDAEDKICLQYLDGKGFVHVLENGCISLTLDGIDFFESE